MFNQLSYILCMYLLCEKESYSNNPKFKVSVGKYIPIYIFLKENYWHTTYRWKRHYRERRSFSWASWVVGKVVWWTMPVFVHYSGEWYSNGVFDALRHIFDALRQILDCLHQSLTYVKIWPLKSNFNVINVSQHCLLGS